MWISLLLPGTAAFAYDHGNNDTWFMHESNTKIKGSLYLVNNDREIAQSKTVNLSDNGVKVRVKIYATADGQTIRGSKNEDVGKTAYVKATARKPDCWGSGHTTTPSSDPYKWLYIQVSDLN
ncbi:hypothetical protein FDA33_09515 [Clostridium botulinum]|uniref:hypothetical protein n=1 Tax=Clostridium botulinum TaxID=1491 RepID=UPI0013F0463E|nr:hypothetical protein [Clostridium botulinum]MBN1041268.1 hypothetical protein [Clostridium botulinum]NFH90428.1 hypothetical protein [Clostridium botulinum]NFI17470.1 hypothetical protein [Clostridium botulinum]NFI53183.1 hypothetical protein [Clostridium botulinum]NFL93000.1 hypothetical protein [Clostridium botulinum]